jgi:isoleucyl-tRNA synthetase
MAPFAADWIHRELVGGTSVHLVRYPRPEGRRDPGLDAAVDIGRKLSGLGRAARESTGIRVRQPLRRLVASVPGNRPAAMDEDLLNVVRDELNVREITFVADPTELVRYRAEPNFAVLGPKFGPLARSVAEAVRGLGNAELSSWRAGEAGLAVEVSGERLEVPADAVLLKEEPPQGFVVQSDGGVVVGLDTELDDELRAEGTARELVNRIQRLRRDAGLELDDRICLGIFGAPEIALAAEAHREYIAGEVLAVEVEIGQQLPKSDNYAHTRELQLDGREAVIGVQVR